MTRHIAIPLTSKRTDVFTPPSLVGEPNEVEFQIRIPTPTERDTQGATLMAAGVVPISQEVIRATMIDELFNTDWGKGEQNEAHAEDLAGTLEGFWQLEIQHEQAMGAWAEQEVQRLEDKKNGVDKPQVPPPADPIPPRMRAKCRLIIHDITEKSQRLRDLLSKHINFDKLATVATVRINLKSMAPKHPDKWPADVALERDQQGFVKVSSIDDLRDHIGKAAWGELVQRVDGHFNLSEEERKNFDSPLENGSDQIGSPGPSGDGESSDGKWTGSDTGPVQTGESATTTGKSSPRRSATASPKPKRGRTAGA